MYCRSKLSYRKSIGLQKHSDQAITLFPNQPSLYYYNGFAHLSNDNHEEAVEILEHGRRIARSDPNMQVVFYSLLGDTYHELEEYTLSEEAYEAVLEVDPDNRSCAQQLQLFPVIEESTFGQS